MFGLDGVTIVEEFLKERSQLVSALVYPVLLDDISPLAPLPYPLPGTPQVSVWGGGRRVGGCRGDWAAGWGFGGAQLRLLIAPFPRSPLSSQMLKRFGALRE